MRSRPLILASLLLAAFAINLDTTIVNVALPTLVRELHASNTQLQWVVDAYNLVFAALLLVAGSLSDRLGRKGMLLSGLGVFGLASLAGGFTTTPGQLILARCFMGLGAAMVFPATLSLISNVFTERAERARAIGLWGATAGMAIALGPIVGGWLLERFSWASIFFAMVPVAVLAGALVAWSVPTSRDPRVAKADLPGFVLSTATMALLIYTIIEAPDHGWSSARSIGGFLAVVVLFVAFVARERRTDEPMLDIGLFRNPRFTAASGSVTVAFFSLFGFIFLMTQYFQFLKGYGPLSAGVHLLPVATLGGDRLGARDQARRALRHEARRRQRPGVRRLLLRVGLGRHIAHHPLRHNRRADGALRRRHGLHQRTRDGGDHGRRTKGQGRRRLGRQRRHPPARGHARRRRDRQRLRLALRRAG